MNNVAQIDPAIAGHPSGIISTISDEALEAYRKLRELPPDEVEQMLSNPEMKQFFVLPGKR